MSLQCPINKFDLCREYRCAMWDKNRVCCGLITQPPINENILLEYIDKRFYEAMMQRRD